jgi:hypothetical protein
MGVRTTLWIAAVITAMTVLWVYGPHCQPGADITVGTVVELAHCPDVGKGK